MSETAPDDLRRQLRRQYRAETETLLRSWEGDLKEFLRTGYRTRDPKRRMILPFPKPDKRPDLYVMADLLVSAPITSGKKSRQVMESNLHLAEPIRDCLCWSNTVWVLKSVNLSMSRELLFDRVRFSLDALPRAVRLRYRINEVTSDNRIDITHRDGEPWSSSLIAAPEGVLSVRQRTLSGLLLDEWDSHAEAEDTYATALSQIQAEEDGVDVVIGKMRMLSTVIPDSEGVALMGERYDEARDLCLDSGLRAA